MICDIYNSDGTPFEGDPRYVLKKALKEAEKMGFCYNVGPEPEFYMFQNHDSVKNKPVDKEGYFDMSSHEGYSLINEIVSALEKFGINVETAHHEVGEGQYEIDFTYGPSIEIADKLLTLKYTVKKITQMKGLRATFMPKPIKGAAGSGLHIHQSLFDIKGERNAFYDKDDKYGISKMAYSFIAGQMKHVKAMTAILCPTVNSYKRLVSGFEAPVYITWAGMNRSSLIRVPKWFGRSPNSARMELRCPDPTCNPYLAFAVLIGAGLDGIKNNMTPPEPTEENVYEFDRAHLADKHIDVLPTSLSDALNEMKKSSLIKEILGKHLFEKYIAIKTREWDEFKMQVTSWEHEKYLDTF